jgi:glycosyltransferase involved in cell wall biosynthesis
MDWNESATPTVKLFVLNSKPADPNGYIFQALVRALHRRSDLQLQVIRPDELRQIPRDPQHQSLLVYGGEELHRIPQEQIQRPFGRRAIWFTEDPYEAKRNQHSAALFQAVFSNDSGSLNLYRKARHLPLAADPELMPLRLNSEPRKLIFFSGTAWPNRKTLLNTLLDHWPDPEAFDLHLVANPVVEQQLGPQSLHHTLSFEAPIAISEFGLRAANSLCTLVVGRDFSGSGQHSYARSPGPRLFEAGITGSCQLVHASEIPDMPAGLEEGEHYLRFSSTEQLLDLLRQAQLDPAPFRAMGAAMASEIQAQHTYNQRAAELVESLLHCRPEATASAELAPRLRALFISHEQTKPGFQHGGAGLCLDQIVAAAPDDVDVRILCRSGDDGHSFTLFDRDGERVGGFRCHQKVNEFSLHHPELEDQIESLLKEWRPQLVHVNHLLGFTPAVLPLARRAGARTVITLHDYYTICDSWNLLDDQHNFCAINKFFDERCQACCVTRRPQFRSVDPTRRRVAMAEALAHAQAVIVPSRAAEQQLRTVLPHLPATQVIEPVAQQSLSQLKPGEGTELIVLIPGNLAINKGYLDLRDIINQINDLDLPVQFRVLGRVEDWIKHELAAIANVKLLGHYESHHFASKATGADLALFLSPWPETYCITFDEWKRSGRACLYYAIGALAEPHRQQGLHQASAGFAVEDRDGLMRALIEATTPTGLQRLREPNTAIQASTEAISFGTHHWSLFEEMLNAPMETAPINWTQRPYQPWVDEHEGPLMASARQKLVSLIYRLPGGRNVAALWRRIRGR